MKALIDHIEQNQVITKLFPPPPASKSIHRHHPLASSFFGTQAAIIIWEKTKEACVMNYLNAAGVNTGYF